jgi:hypothetical protein
MQLAPNTTTIPESESETLHGEEEGREEEEASAPKTLPVAAPDGR